MTGRKVVLVLVAGLMCSAIHASERCKVKLEPTTSGFFLSPTLEKVLVHKVTPRVPGQTCVMMVGDELLEVNERVIPGSKAKEVMKYWKSLPEHSPVTFKVRREGSVIIVTSR